MSGWFGLASAAGLPRDLGGILVSFLSDVYTTVSSLDLAVKLVRVDLERCPNVT